MKKSSNYSRKSSKDDTVKLEAQGDLESQDDGREEDNHRSFEEKERTDELYEGGMKEK